MSSPRHAERARTEPRPSGHGHAHGHDRALAASVRTTARTRVVVLALLLPVLVATVVGAVVLWPSGDRLPDKVPSTVAGAVVLHGTVTGPADDHGNVPVRVTHVGTPVPDPTAPSSDRAPAPVKVGQTVEANAPTELVQYGFEAGQKVTVLYLPTGAADVAQDPGTGSDQSAGADEGETDTGAGGSPGTDPVDGSVDLANQSAYGIVDFDRSFPIGILALTFAVLVVVVARWRGLAALAGLAVALVTVGYFTVPALLEGRSAIGVALVTAVAVMFVTLYLAHGFSIRTSTALLGTLAGIAIAATLAWWASGAAQVTGATSEESYWLPSQAPHVNLAGVALCGMILAGLGALNDVTITQASSVWELRALAPDTSRRALFTSALRIGRDHIASTVYTIAFAYLGASLPLLLAVWLQEQPLSLSLTTGSIVEEIVRTLVGTIGLVLAIPLTTAIAAICVPAGPAVRSARRPDAGRAGTAQGAVPPPVDSAAAMDPAEATVVGTGRTSDSEFWSDRRGRA